MFRRLFAFLLALTFVASCQEIVFEDDPEETSKGETGGEESGITEEEKETAITVGKLSSVADNETVTLTGYIVGYVPSGSVTATKFTAKDAVESNIVLAERPDESEPTRCVAVQLVKGTTIRSVLNLASNPNNLGRKVFITGKKAIYYKFPGLKAPTAYVWDDNPEQPDNPEPPETNDSIFSSRPTISSDAARLLEGC